MARWARPGPPDVSTRPPGNTWFLDPEPQIARQLVQTLRNLSADGVGRCFRRGNVFRTSSPFLESIGGLVQGGLGVGEHGVRRDLLAAGMYQTDPLTIVGYPWIAMLLFLAAATGGFWMAWTILAGDVRKAHGPDESVPVNDLVTVTKSLVMLLARACGAS